MHQLPMETTGCGLNQCYETSYSSPLNFAESEAAQPHTGSPDGTVEFNEIVFDAAMKFIYVGSQGIRYDHDAVMRRTLVHEMGHALLGCLRKRSLHRSTVHHVPFGGRLGDARFWSRKIVCTSPEGPRILEHAAWSIATVTINK